MRSERCEIKYLLRIMRDPQRQLSLIDWVRTVAVKLIQVVSRKLVSAFNIVKQAKTDFQTSRASKRLRLQEQMRRDCSQKRSGIPRRDLESQGKITWAHAVLGSA